MVILIFLRLLKGCIARFGFGIHSPFAFEFVSMLREIDNFLPVKEKQLQIISMLQKKYDLTVKECSLDDINDIQNIVANEIGEFFIVVNNIYANKNKFNNWKKIQANKNICVTFDLYHTGILVVRNGLSKNNYIINC